MKNFKALLSFILMFAVVTGTSFASPAENTEGKLQNLKTKFDSRTAELSKEELNIYKTYKGDERKQKLDEFYNSEAVKSLQNDFRDAVIGDIELEKAYIQQLGVSHLNKIDLESETILSTQDVAAPTEDYFIEKIVEHSDGSFSVLSGTLTEHETEDEDSIGTMAYTNGIGDYDFLWDFEYRHLVYPNSHFTIKTYYSTHTTSPHLKVYNATNAGTRGQLPLVSVTASAKIDHNFATKSTKARTSGNFNITFAGYNGIGLHSESWDGNASFIIRDYTSNSVTISTEASFTQG
ncbi:hypothetical protein ACPV3A_08655 [Paenibacillus sp. Dod16]|uniref:hypothetical protein n=1 Tax=Paenibacillus TaxID=44249 RepID=UPI001C7D2E26|nr:hypothetical protein [Paenibacillus lautus]MBX4150679.1 hypothetical protein [Paenibacillus lautus]